MRLIDTKTGFFVDFPDFSMAPSYAILSHTWDSKGEQTYQDVREIQERYKRATRRASTNPRIYGPIANTVPEPELPPDKEMVPCDRLFFRQANSASFLSCFCADH